MASWWKPTFIFPFSLSLTLSYSFSFFLSFSDAPNLSFHSLSLVFCVFLSLSLVSTHVPFLYLHFPSIFLSVNSSLSFSFSCFLFYCFFLLALSPSFIPICSNYQSFSSSTTQRSFLFTSLSLFLHSSPTSFLSLPIRLITGCLSDYDSTIHFCQQKEGNLRDSNFFPQPFLTLSLSLCYTHTHSASS